MKRRATGGDILLPGLCLLGCLLAGQRPAHGAPGPGEPRPDDDRRVRYWASRLTDADSAVRREAADELGDRGAESAAAVPALIAALNDPVASVREEIVDAIGDIARRAGPELARRAVSALAEVLTGDSHEGVRRDAAEKLEDIGREATLEIRAAVLGALTAGLSDPGSKVRGRCVEAIGSVLRRSEEGLRFLRFRIERESRRGEAGAARERLLRTAEDLELAMKRASDAVVALHRKDPAAGDRETVIETLGRALRVLERPGEGLIAVVVAALGDRDEDVREEAREALRRAVERRGAPSSPEGAAGAVLDGLSGAYREGDVRLRGRIVAALDDLVERLPGAVLLLERAAKDMEAAIRESAVDALGDIGRRSLRERPDLARSVVGPLAGALQDADEDVREEAADALGHLGAAARDAVARLVAALDHPEAGTRESAAEALGRIGRPLDGASPEIVDALRRAASDPDGRVRRAAGRALERVGGH